MFNFAAFTGRLTADPQIIRDDHGTYVTFLLAADPDQYNEGQSPCVVSCVAWNQSAEFLEKYFQRGSMVTVQGRLESSSWTGADQKSHYEMSVRVDSLWFGEAKARKMDDASVPVQQDTFPFPERDK